MNPAALLICAGLVFLFASPHPPEGPAAWLLLWGGLWLALGLYTAGARREAGLDGRAQARGFLVAAGAVAPLAAASAILTAFAKSGTFSF